MAITMAAAAVIGTGYGIYSGERGAAAQRLGMRRQKAAQDAALASQQRQERAAAEVDAQQRRRTPNLMSILDNQGPMSLGSALSGGSGAGGVDPSRLRLGGTKLLGG